MKRWLMSALLLIPATAAAQDVLPPPRTVAVNATATIEREPELANIVLAVQSEAPAARDAAQENATKMDRVIEALRQLGITGDDVRTLSYEIQPQYAHRNPTREQPEVLPPRIVGYRAINMVQVTVDPVDGAGAAIDAALEAGANRVENLTFGLRDYDSARLDAIRQAVENARREAEVLAAAAGQRLAEPLTISSSSYRPPQPFPAPAMMRMEAMDAVAAPTPIQVGTLNVMATVHIVYRIENR